MSITDYSSFPPYEGVSIVCIGVLAQLIKRHMIAAGEMKIVDYALGAALVTAVGAWTVPGNKH
jgi:hypothetical protein